MQVLNAYSRVLVVLSKILRAILIVLLASMVIIMIYNVICRYIFSDAKPWAEELTLYISIFSIMLGLGIASRSDSHLQVDYLTRLYKPKVRCLMAARSVTLPITMREIYMAFPIGSAILILYSIEIIARNLVGFAHGGELPALPGREKGGDAE